jgi:aspartyl-tRNA(Asn)/glutamyl-tRNA(Gln) amidotransferase subunit B
MYKGYELTIGLEIHAELATASKIFCSCSTAFGSKPNTHCCPVCMGFPGTMPVLNKKALRLAVKAGLVTDCRISPVVKFDRKHYSYPDLPKAYQITQYDTPLCTGGTVSIPTEEGAKSIRITRIHMEEDAAKLVHVGGEEGRIASASESLIDYNRCGTPLIELVTEPDLRTPEEARLFVEKLRQTFLALGISDCSLESGSMRCDGNVSVRRRGATTMGTKTELKNINSLKSLHDALAFEICRQAEVLERGGVVRQETRHWEPSKRRTVVMRVKEAADDYRMYPDPDLAPFELTTDFVECCRARVPELPDAKRDRYVAEYGLKRRDATYLAADPATARLFEHAVGRGVCDALTIANVVINLVPATRSVTAAQVASLSTLLASDAITFAQAREVLGLVDGTGDDPQRVVDDRGMRQSTDAEALAAIVDEVLSCCADQARQYREGNGKVIGYLVGQCMRSSHGTGNPKLFNRLLRERLEA